MATIPCALVLKQCLPCNDTPIANITAEAPDVDVFIGFRDFKWNPPLGVTYFQLGCKSLCFSTESQAAANLCALQNAQECVFNGGDDPVSPPVPPGPDDHGGKGLGPNTPGRIPPSGPGRPINRFRNREQTCDSQCPDGSPFSEVVAAGTITELSQALADEKAKSLACKRAEANLFCISADEPPSSCVGEDYFFRITASSGEDLVWSIDGQLPPGLSFDLFEATITGTPVTGGSFTFAVDVSDSRGRTQSKAFTICIMEIVTDAELPEATIGEEYSTPLVQQDATVSSEVWTLVSGELPDGITLASNGALNGTPTSPGASEFTLRVDATCDGQEVSCQKTFTLEVSGTCGVDWSLITWDVANFIVVGVGGGAPATASGTALGDTVSFALSGGAFNGIQVAEALIHGFVVADCNTCSFKMRINLIGYHSDAIFGIRVYQDGALKFTKIHGDGSPSFPSSLVLGMNEFNVPLIEATASLIEFRADVVPATDIMGIAVGALFEPIPPSINLSITMSDT